MFSSFILSRTISGASIWQHRGPIVPRFSNHLPKMNSFRNCRGKAWRPISTDTVGTDGNGRLQQVRNFAAVAGSGSREPVPVSYSYYDEEFPVLSASAVSSKNKKSNKMRTRVDLITEEDTRRNSSSHHESPPMYSATSKNYDTSLPSDFRKKGTPSCSTELQHVQSCMDDKVSNTNVEQDSSKRPASTGNKGMPRHLRQSERENDIKKYEPGESYLPTQFGKHRTPSHYKRPLLSQPHHSHDVGIENSECPRGLQKFEPFDICNPEIMHPANLNYPLHVSNRGKENEIKRFEGTTKQVLRQGMVLLKDYISHAEQIEMVKKCRDLGVGPGGFYRPGFQNGAKLHLQMMCLGLNWDPQTRRYENCHPLDGSEPHDIPHEFRVLVERSIQDSHCLIKKNTGTNNVEGILPRMSPNLCILNFYTATGRLGLHQDLDESKESLHKGLPVVSFSLGDSAVFLYGEQRNVEAADSVLLESGDVLIFGGSSRLIFHGVSSIIPNSAPKFLLEETNLRPGRLNLTFRQY